MYFSSRRALITAGLEAIAWSNAGRFFPKAAGRGIIFTLHHVRPPSTGRFEPNAQLSITPEFLDTTIRQTLDEGYIPVALEDFPDALEAASGHERFVAFTLDDGWRDNLQHAAPVFLRHDIPFTLFITTGFAERTHTMWWETAEALLRHVAQFIFDFGGGQETIRCRTSLQKHTAFERIAKFIDSADEDVAVARLNAVSRAHGIDPDAIVRQQIMDRHELGALAKNPLARFGAHSDSHPNLARIGTDRLEREIAGPIEAIANWTGRRPKSIAYPYGFRHACGAREAAAARNAGLTVGVTTQPGVIPASGTNWMLAPRVSLNGHYQKRRYIKALLSGIAFPLM